ncbi:alcohol acetyltransferase [Mycena vulgaris]|nr:alcohol acetyltransferase [Mycena vulgaris]
MTTLQLVRPLSFLEKYYTVRHLLGMDAYVVTSARYTTPENTPLTKEHLFPALRILVETHATLGVRLEGKEDTPDLAFVRLPSVNLSQVVVFSGKSDLQEALERHLSQGLKNTQGDLPLWRLEVLADNIVILAAHHSILDGLSHSAFHQSLLQELRESSPRPYVSSVVVPELLLLPPLEVVADVRPTLFNIVGAFYELLAPKSWQNAYSAWTGRPVPTVIALQTHIRLLSFAPADAARFTDTCRVHNATVTSTLYVLAVCALARLLADEPEQQYKTVSVLVPLSLRPIVGVPSDVFGNYISSHHAFPPLDPVFSWAAAARFAVELQAQKNAGARPLGMLRYVEKHYARFFKGTLGKKRRFGLALSNLGRVQTPSPSVESKWSMGEMFFSPCDTLTGAALGINVVGDPTGRLNISFKWGAESLDTAFVEAFISMFRDSVHSLLA